MTDLSTIKIPKKPEILESKEEIPFALPDNGSIAGNLHDNAINEIWFEDTYYSTKNANLFGTAINYHKALDFSNVGDNKPIGALSPNIDFSSKNLATAFRQFHQTRIYVEGSSTFQGMNRHTKLEDGKNKTFVISANLPEQVNYSIGSQWQAPLAGLGGPLLSVMASLLKGSTDLEWLPDSFYNRFQTVQVWAGTSPLNMSITIPVIDDGSFNKKQKYEGKQNSVNTNLAEALEFLGSLCLPAKVDRDDNGDNSEKTRYGFYIPPPSPLSLKARWYSYDKKDDKKVATANELKVNVQNNARIMIQIGGMLLIDNCIITGIRVNYNNTKSLIRHHYDAEQNNEVELDYLTPQIASVTISFSTIEAITANDYGKMLWLRRQPDMGTGVVSSLEFQNAIVKADYTNLNQQKQKQPQNT